MKRCKKVILILSGALTTLPMGCSRAPRDLPPVELSTENTYTNNHYVPGAGYYHAHYGSWFPYPYNHHDPARGYFAGGSWSPEAHTSALTASKPASGAVANAQAAHSALRAKAASSTTRTGFGRSATFRTGIS